MKFQTLIVLAAGTAVSARTVILPLRSGSVQEDGQRPRGVSKNQRRASNSSGVNVPVTGEYCFIKPLTPPLGTGMMACRAVLLYVSFLSFLFLKECTLMRAQRLVQSDRQPGECFVVRLYAPYVLYRNLTNHHSGTPPLA